MLLARLLNSVMANTFNVIEPKRRKVPKVEQNGTLAYIPYGQNEYGSRQAGLFPAPDRPPRQRLTAKGVRAELGGRYFSADDTDVNVLLSLPLSTGLSDSGVSGD